MGLLLMACDRSAATGQQADPKAATVPASPAATAAPVVAPWPVGSWHAQLEPGALQLTIESSGEVRGTFDHRGAVAHVSGVYEPEPAVLRLKVASTTFYGTLVCTRQGETWVGPLRATPHAGAAFENDAGPFGEQWDVTLVRF